MKKLSNKSISLLLITFLFVLGCILIWLSPSEETLGNLVKLVYFHAAVVYAALFAFLIAGILGLVYIVTSKQKVYLWVCAFQKTAFLFWSTYFVSSIVLTYLAWGGVGWMEPRFQLAIRILVMVSVVFLLSMWINKPKFIAALNSGLFLVIFYLTSTVQRIFHPSNPIGKSNSITMKAYAALILIIFCSIAFLTAYLFLPSKEQQQSH